MQLEADGAVNEAIEDGVREGWIIELSVPVGHRQLTGHDHRAAAEAVVEDFEEIAPPDLADGWRVGALATEGAWLATCWKSRLRAGLFARLEVRREDWALRMQRTSQVGTFPVCQVPIWPASSDGHTRYSVV